MGRVFVAFCDLVSVKRVFCEVEADTEEEALAKAKREMTFWVSVDEKFSPDEDTEFTLDNWEIEPRDDGELSLNL